MTLPLAVLTMNEMSCSQGQSVLATWTVAQPLDMDKQHISGEWVSD